MDICVTDAKAVNPNIKLGICGEQGGDPDSVKFCNKLGLTYVSCSPNASPPHVWPQHKPRLKRSNVGLVK